MSQVKFYPVDNGDTSLIQVSEGGYSTNIIVDCNIRNESIGSKDPTMYDVKADLLRSLNTKTVNGILAVPYTDLFILSHGDIDHVRGFKQHFYQGDPRKYGKANKDAGEIFIDVLWFSPMVMGKSGNDDEDVFNKEARRRIQLHRDKSADRDLPGNRITIIGYDGNEKLDGLDLVRYVPGQIVTRFNNREHNTFSTFIHSPYQKDLADDYVDKNGVSIVFQARFKNQPYDTKFASLFMFAGDANHEAIAQIIDKTKRYGNDVRHNALQWDAMIAPHHCSWTFFNFCPYDKNTTAAPMSLQFLRYKRSDGAVVIASCKPILDDDDNPPHYPAKEEYVAIVTTKNFYNLATANLKGKTPQPVIYEVTPNGPMKPKRQEGTATVAGSAGLSTVNENSEYGSGNV